MKYLKYLNEAIKYCQELKKDCLSRINDVLYVESKLIILEEKLLIEKDHQVKTIILDHLAHVYNELGVSDLNLSFLDLAEGYFRQIDMNILIDGSKYETTFRRARNYFYQYRVRKIKSQEKQIHFDSYKSFKTYLIPAHSIYQKCFRTGIIEDSLKSELIRKYIIIDLAHISIEMNRWVEIEYYISFLPDIDSSFTSFLLKAVATDAYVKNSHATPHYKVSSYIIQNCFNALKFSDMGAKNIETVSKLMVEYASLLGDTQVSIMEEKSKTEKHLDQEKPSKISAYQKWTLQNYLVLNEHSIYCNCSLAKRDDLYVRTNHKHTHKKWLYDLQLLIEHLKFDFAEARLALYNSQKDVKIQNSISVKNCVRGGYVELNTKNRMLISSFKQAYSILDRIAVSLFSIFDDVESRGVYFHDAFDYLKNKVDIGSKPYLMAIESLAYELDHQNMQGNFREYKTWRDAIEHNYFFLSDNDDLELVKGRYSNLNRIEIISSDDFNSKCYHLLQICRSAIFTLTFLMRNESCRRFFPKANHSY